VLERGVRRLGIVAVDHRGRHAERLAALGDLIVAVLAGERRRDAVAIVGDQDQQRYAHGV